MSTDNVLTAADDFLGDGYREVGKSRFVSQDGTKVVRMGDNDLLGKHGGGPHVNFETLKPNPAKPEKMMIDKKAHVYYED
ncbi:hypothetical protein [Candidatus Albibeggiatoa sp. nov. NOAA]|uniref:hypothetical protein n=1 Tax=Candidatus Albibeggiatoa sp. nov. NOAA TaxID=3162724 RepID=UPI0032F46EA7|nr:hypothetical protein [Thiotrichaceae bacterium]